MKMKKKAMSSIALMLAATTVLTACGKEEPAPAAAEPAAPAAPTADAPVTIRFAWWGSDSRHEALQNVAKLYMEKNPNVTIECEYGAFDGWGQKILTMLSGQEEPDVMQLNYNWVHSFGKGTNVFYDLNKLESIDLSNWDQAELDAMTVGGELAAVPHGFTARAQLYNTALFKEFGLEYPKTYDELISYGAIVGANNTETGADNKYVLTNIGEVSTDLFIAQMLYNKTGKIMQTDGKVNYTEAEVKEVLELYKAMEDAGSLPKFIQEDPIQNESNPVWTAGNSGSVYEWINSMDKYLTSYKGGTANDEISVAPYLTYKEGDKVSVYTKPSLGFGVSKNSKNPEVAADFINFMFTDPEAVVMIGSQLGISTNKVTRPIQEENGMIKGGMAAGYELLAGYETVVLDPYFEDGSVRDKRYEVIEAFRSGIMTSDEAAKNYIEYQQASLDKLFK